MENEINAMMGSESDPEFVARVIDRASEMEGTKHDAAMLLMCAAAVQRGHKLDDITARMEAFGAAVGGKN